MGKISKKHMAYAILLLMFCCGVASAQEASQQFVSESSVPADVPIAVDEANLPIGNAVSVAPASEPRDTSTVFLLIRMILVLAIVIGCIYFVIWMMRRSTRVANNSDPFLRSVSSITLAPGKTVHVVTLLDHAYIVGVTDNAVNLIGDVTDKELVDAMNLYSDKQGETSKPRNFNDVLSIFMPNIPRGNNKNVFDGSVASAEELLRRQRDRLQGGEE